MALGGSLLLLALLAVPGDGPDETSVTLPFTLTDGDGYRWDIRANGSIADGTDDAYDGGVILHVNGRPFPNREAARRVGDREVVFGPVEMGGLRVTRRIRVPEDDGLARFIETVENVGRRPVRVRIGISSQLGGRIGTLQIAPADPPDGAGIIAFVTDDGDPTGGDPAILHCIGSTGGSLVPSIEGRLGERTVGYAIDGIVIAPSGRVLFLHAEMQRRTAAEAIEEMDRFDLQRILVDIPREERADLLNVSYPFHLPDDTDVPREEDRDVLTLRDGDSIYGEAQNLTYRAITDFGPMEIPGEMVVAIVGRDRPGRPRVYLKTGEVYRARLPDLILEFDLPSGHSLRIPGDRIASLGLRKREGEVRGPHWEGHVATLISGDRLVGELGEEALSFRTIYGTATFPVDRIARVERRKEAPWLHRVLLRDGSTLRGLLEQRTIRFRIGGEREIEFGGELIEDLHLAVASLAEEDPRVILETGDEFVGRIANEVITLETPFARIDLDPRQLRSLKALEDSRGEARAVLWDDTTVSGDLRDEEITVRLLGGEELTVRSALLSEAWSLYPGLPDPIRARIEHLISQLGSPEWDSREAAEKELIEIGRPALGLLLGYRDAEDPEVRERVRRVIEAIS